MTMTTKRVSQIELARDLRVTDRRIRQMVDERLLPRPNEDGHDLEICRSRYDLYRSGTSGDWESLFDEGVEQAKEAERLLEKAYADSAVLADVTAASTAVQASTATMCFITATKSKSQAEREMFWNLWEGQEKRAIQGLIVRMMEITGETHIRLNDTGELVEIISPERAALNRKERRATKSTAKRAGRVR
jgi:hypothetical protein